MVERHTGISWHSKLPSGPGFPGTGGELPVTRTYQEEFEKIHSRCLREKMLALEGPGNPQVQNLRERRNHRLWGDIRWRNRERGRLSSSTGRRTHKCEQPESGDIGLLPRHQDSFSPGSARRVLDEGSRLGGGHAGWGAGQPSRLRQRGAGPYRGLPFSLKFRFLN